MPSIVPELVNIATDPAVSTSDLLRKALVVARRLAVAELVVWIDSELNGYKSDDLPNYRILGGQLKAENPIRGLIPIFLPDPDLVEQLSTAKIYQSVPELVQLSHCENTLILHLPHEVELHLMELLNVQMRPVICLSAIQVHGVVEKVRSRILEWALDLESRGVLGEGMTFTSQEKKIVQEQHYHFGDVSGSQIQIGSTHSNQHQNQTDIGNAEALNALIEVISGALERKEISGEQADELKAELLTLQAHAALPKPKWQVIRAVACSIQSVLENAAGGVLATQALPYISQLLK